MHRKSFIKFPNLSTQVIHVLSSWKNEHSNYLATASFAPISVLYYYIWWFIFVVVTILDCCLLLISSWDYLSFKIFFSSRLYVISSTILRSFISDFTSLTFGSCSSVGNLKVVSWAVCWAVCWGRAKRCESSFLHGVSYWFIIYMGNICWRLTTI